MGEYETIRDIVIGCVAAVGGPAAVIKGLRAMTQHRGAVLTRLDEIQTSIKRIDANLRAQAHTDPRPMIFTTEHGHANFINRSFSRRLGWTPEQMLGMGWVNAIAFEDRTKVVDEWTLGVRDKRDFGVPNVRLVHRDVAAVLVGRLEGQRMTCNDGTGFGWQCILHIESGHDHA